MIAYSWLYSSCSSSAQACAWANSCCSWRSRRRAPSSRLFATKTHFGVSPIHNHGKRALHPPPEFGLAYIYIVHPEQANIRHSILLYLDMFSTNKNPRNYILVEQKCRVRVAVLTLRYFGTIPPNYLIQLIVLSEAED